jgi:hypothetical protein
MEYLFILIQSVEKHSTKNLCNSDLHGYMLEHPCMERYDVDRVCQLRDNPSPADNQQETSYTYSMNVLRPKPEEQRPSTPIQVGVDPFREMEQRALPAAVLSYDPQAYRYGQGVRRSIGEAFKEPK